MINRFFVAAGGCLLLVAVVNSTLLAAPGDQYPEHFADLLTAGQRVILVPVTDTSAFEIHVVSRPLPGNVRADRIRTIVARGRDYVSLRTGEETRHIPLHAIRSILGGSPDVLERPVTLELARTPLRDAMEMLAKEIGVPIRVDAEALKMDGYTLNMPVRASLKEAPAHRLLAIIQQDQPGLILAVFDDHFLLTTRAAAKRDRLEVRDFRGRDGER